MPLMIVDSANIRSKSKTENCTGNLFLFCLSFYLVLTLMKTSDRKVNFISLFLSKRNVNL